MAEASVPSALPRLWEACGLVSSYTHRAGETSPLGPQSPRAQQDPAPRRDWPASAVFLWGGVGCSHPFPSLPAVLVDQLEALGVGEMPVRAFLQVDKTDALLLFGVVLPSALGSACFCGRELNLQCSCPCLLQHAWTHAHTCPSVLTSVSGS